MYILAPKVYGGILSDNKNTKNTKEIEYVRVKGLKNPLPYSDLELLLNKDKKLGLSQEKWNKHFDKGNISIKEEIYTLKITDNKDN